MTDTQHAQSLEEEVVSNDPVTDQEPAPDEPYGHLPQATAGVNPWRVQSETTVPEGRRGRGFVLPRMATPAGVIGHHFDWAIAGAPGVMKLQGENPLSFAFLNYSSLGVYGFFRTQAGRVGQQHWFVPPYSALTLGTKGPIAWLFDPNGSQAASPSTSAMPESYVVQAYDRLLTPSLRSLNQPAGLQVAAAPRGASVSYYGTKTAPGVNATIVATSIPAAGLYDVEVRFSYGATGDVSSNLGLLINGISWGQLVTPGGANTEMDPVIVRRVQLDGVHNLTLYTIAAGASGSIYQGQLILTPVY